MQNSKILIVSQEIISQLKVSTRKKREKIEFEISKKVLCLQWRLTMKKMKLWQDCNSEKKAKK